MARERKLLAVLAQEMWPSSRAANAGPQWIEFGHDAFAELVARTGEGEGDVRVQALEAAGRGTRTTYTEVQLRPELPLLGVCALEAVRKSGVLAGGASPAFHSAGGLEPRDGDDEVRTCQPERGWKRFPVLVIGVLFCHRRPAERTAHNDAPKCSRRTS
jgi:hypothetical protein